MYDSDLTLDSLYNQLYKIWLHELKSESIIEISSDFDLQYSGLITEAKQKLELQAFNELAKSIISRIEFIYSDFKSLRFQKVITALMSGGKYPSTLLSRSEVLFQENTSSLFQSYFENQINDQPVRLKDSKRSPEIEIVEPNPNEQKRNVVETEKLAAFILLRFTKKIPAFIGTDGHSYGPFSSQDIAMIPYKNGELLITKGIASTIDNDH